MADKEDCWMPTFMGRRVFPLAEAYELLDVVDIAHALAFTCRFGGHTKKFYSVAQHCVIVSHVVERTHALWGLMHDAAEAYLGDIIAPLKGWAPELASAEQRIIKLIGDWLNLPWPIPEEVWAADRAACVTEARDLMLLPPEFDSPTWGIAEPPLREPISPWTLNRSETEFLLRYEELVGGGGPIDRLHARRKEFQALELQAVIAAAGDKTE